MTVWLQRNDWTYEYFDLDEDASTFHNAEEFVKLWKHKRGIRRLPTLSDYDWDEFFPWWGLIILADILWNPFDYQYRLFGTKVANRFDIDVTGKKASELTDGNYMQEAEDIEFYEMTCRGPYITQVSGPLYWQNREHIHTRFVELPLSDTGGRVTHSLALMI